MAVRTSTRRDAAEGNGGADRGEPASLADGLRVPLVEITRTRSDIGLKPKHKGALRSLGVPRKIGRKAIHRLTPDIAGAIQAVRPYVATHLVLPSNHKIEISPSDAVELGKRGGRVSPKPYRIDDEISGVHLEWPSGETARVEHHQDFVLVAWTSRLTAGDALELLRATGRKGDLLMVDTLDESTELDVAAPLPERLRSSSQLVRLMRLETDAETLIWEIPFNGQPASRRPAKGGYPTGEPPPVFAVLAERLPEDRLRHHLDDTADAVVAYDADDLVKAL